MQAAAQAASCLRTRNFSGIQTRMLRLKPQQCRLSHSCSSSSHNHHQLQQQWQWQVAAFTDNGSRGNPAAIVHLDLKRCLEDKIANSNSNSNSNNSNSGSSSICNNNNKTDDSWLQHVATESGAPITSFISQSLVGATPSSSSTSLSTTAVATYKIRWFTPTKEIELCGHGTIAAAHILYNKLREVPTDREIEFETKFSGKIIVRVREGLMELVFPKVQLSTTPLAEIDLSNISRSFQISCESLRKSILFAGVSKYDVVLELTPELFHNLPHDNIDFDALSQVATNRGIILTTRASGDYQFLLRMFLPRYGINEDHVSGSAFCAIAEFWDAKLNFQGTKMKGFQCSKIGGKVHVCVERDQVILGGECVLIN